jgi:hypothetical protein
MRFRGSCLALALLLAAGCGDSGPPTGTVKGRLTIGGAAPPEPVLIYFINSSVGQGGAARSDAEGQYSLPQPIRVGEYKVYFERIVEQATGPISTDQEQLKFVPPEYRNEMDSPLKKMVNEGENTIDLDVPSVGSKRK